MSVKSWMLVVAGLVVAAGILFAFSGSDERSNGLNSVTTSNLESQTDSSVPRGAYQPYSQSTISSLPTDQKIILFFHASWCPTCKTLDKDINANLGAIPENTTILKVNYDQETALKQKYSVRLQHTLVQIDNSGAQIAQWNGSPTLQDVLRRIQ